MKRLRMEQGEEGEDRISDLPEGILVHILSFLDTNHSIRTGALSTRWKKLWSYVPHLAFDLTGVSSSGKTRTHVQHHQLMYFIRRRRRPRSPNSNSCFIRKFSFNYDYYDPQTSKFFVSACLPSMLCPGVQELSIELPSSSLTKRIVGQLLACNTLVHLKLVEQGRERCKETPYLYLPPEVDLPNLKTLHLCVHQVTIVAATKLFASCPKLESLTLLACYFDPTVLTFKIFAPNLKHLVFGIDPPRDEDHYHNVLIKAPLLQTLHISGILGTYIFGGGSSSSSLIEAGLDLLQEINRYRLTGAWLLHILKEISGVKSLRITRPLSMALDDCTRDGSLVFPNLTRLELKGISMSQTLGLLKLAPNVEYLKLSDHGLRFDDGEGDDLAPSCLLSSMKVIEVEESSGWRNRLRLMEYFLKNCQVLEKMIINCARVAGDGNHLNDDLSKEMSNLQTEISRFVMGSKICQVEFLGPEKKT